MVKITKIALGLMVTTIIAGCGSNPVRTETETQQVNKPILYCPAPQNIERPELAHQTINESDSDGRVVQKYKAALQQLIDYSKQLEQHLQQYGNTNQAYEELRKQLEQRSQTTDR